jgi:hypothetical protein
MYRTDINRCNISDRLFIMPRMLPIPCRRALEGSKSATDFLQAVHEVLLETTRRINNPLREPLQK